MIIVSSPKNATTKDIIATIAQALPVAVQQIKGKNLPKPSKDIVTIARSIGRFTQKKFKYKKDGLTYQDIQLPSALERSKAGDCKSLSLYIAAYLTSLNIRNGLRFAAYNTPEVTHVYNYYFDENNKLHTLDACIKDLKESPNYTKLQDMQTRIIAGVPVLFDEEINGPRRDERRRRRQERREEREERREAGGAGKQIPLAIPRKAFLALVSINFRNLAKRQNELLQKNPNDLKAFWLKLGGDFSKLQQAINEGKNKRPVFGKGKRVNGIAEEPGTSAEGGDTLKTIEKFLPFIGPIVTALTNLFKKNKIDDSGVLEPGEAQPLGNFQASDPETKEAEQYTKTTPGKTESALGFKINPLLLAGGLVAVYLLTKKKGK